MFNPFDCLITEWLPECRACGKSGFGDACRTNKHWVDFELRRIADKGTHACIVRRRNKYLDCDDLAVSMLPDGVTAAQLQAEFDRAAEFAEAAKEPAE
jgi:hypothetical protein